MIQVGVTSTGMTNGVCDPQGSICKHCTVDVCCVLVPTLLVPSTASVFPVNPPVATSVDHSVQMLTTSFSTAKVSLFFYVNILPYTYRVLECPSTFSAALVPEVFFPYGF